jgi:GNAT superfamily N-acetyltransferase
MSSNIEISLLSKDEWERLKAIRIRALTENSDAFGQTLEEVKALSKDEWFKYYEKSDYLIASIDGKDIGMLYIEVLNGDHGATCWIGGCWTDPAHRGKGVMRALFNYIDLHAKEKDWSRQGLGVWTDNYSAIKAYEYLGFAFAGEKMPGSREGKFFQHMIRNTSL